MKRQQSLVISFIPYKGSIPRRLRRDSLFGLINLVSCGTIHIVATQVVGVVDTPSARGGVVHSKSLIIISRISGRDSSPVE